MPPPKQLGSPLLPRAHQPTASISPPRGATQDRRQRGTALQVIESKQPRTPQPHSGDLGLGVGGGRLILGTAFSPNCSQTSPGRTPLGTGPTWPPVAMVKRFSWP